MRRFLIPALVFSAFFVLGLAGTASAMIPAVPLQLKLTDIWIVLSDP